MKNEQQVQIILRQFIQVYELKLARTQLEIDDPKKYTFSNWSEKNSYLQGFKAGIHEAIAAVREALGEK